MEIGSSILEITYFPYTFLDETDLKPLILYFESVQLLQVSPHIDPRLPTPLDSLPLVQSFCPITSSALQETIERALITYRQMGEAHRDSGLLQLLRSFALQEDLERSTTGLVAHLRQAHPRLAPEEVELVHDAVFLLLAHDFDREHLELNHQLDRIRGLETKFHRDVGIGTDDDMDLASPRMVESDRPRTQYPLRRLRAWTHLYCSQQSPEPFIPLTTCVEVLEEIAERLPPQGADRAGGLETIQLGRKTLASLLDPQPLTLEETLDLRQVLITEGLLEKWWEDLASALQRLQRETITEERSRDLQQRLQETVDGFQRHWPSAAKPTQELLLDSVSYPGLPSHRAFALATGLPFPDPRPDSPEATKGITLLLSPSTPSWEKNPRR